MKTKIAFKFCNGLRVQAFSEGSADAGYSMAFISNLLALGFMPNAELVDALGELTLGEITSLSKKVIPVLEDSVGANVLHRPFYPNFPSQVMDVEEAEHFGNAMFHYLSDGNWLPNFRIDDRPVSFENIEFKTLGVVTEADIDNVFTQILSSADSISDSSKEVVKWFINSGRHLLMPQTIPFKENVCLVASLLIEKGKWSSTLVKDTTDVLRIVTHYNGGDISLAENTKFKSLPRKMRRAFCEDLERVAKEEDFVMHKQKWVKLLHNLHVGDYSKTLYDIAKKLRENIKIETFNGKLESAIAGNDITTALNLVKTRPGIFARNIARMLTEFTIAKDRQNIVDTFGTVADQVPARNLTQLWGSIKTRNEVVDKRVVFPKGSLAKAYVLRNKLARLPQTYITSVIAHIKNSLGDRFSELEDLGNVYIDPSMYDCPLPTGMRSASEGLKEVARGTRLPIGNKNTLRFFIYWVGQDIDLSATFHDEEFNEVGQVSFTNLRAGGYNACHSGDITNAPRGASEFIDIDIESVLKSSKNIRYVAMNVYVYSGPNFNEHDTCFAGWMTRSKPNSNEIYDAKTVEQKVDLQSASRTAIPVMFDLVERKAIWCDIAVKGNGFSSSKFSNQGNCTENNKASTQDMVEAFTSLDNKITLGDLFEMHGQARGKIVDLREDADTVFGLGQGDTVTPYDVTTINADFL